MRWSIIVIVCAVALGLTAAPAAAQTPSSGYYQDGYYYVPGGYVPDGATPYWPSNNETAYDYGVYAVAPGFGPYLRLGGEGGWNPNLGSTWNSYPPGDYWSDYGLPNPFYASLGYYAVPFWGRAYGYPLYRGSPFYGPGYGYWR
jgi:hypothetical protein